MSSERGTQALFSWLSRRWAAGQAFGDLLAIPAVIPISIAGAPVVAMPDAAAPVALALAGLVLTYMGLAMRCSRAKG